MAEQPKKVTGGAFGRYMNENRAALLKELPGKRATESIKLGSARFKALDAAAKAKYEKMYTEAKAKYEKDLAAFLAAGGEMKANKVKKGKKVKQSKDPNKPKQPAGGAFGCFLAKNRPEFQKACADKLGPSAIAAVAQLASTRWKELSAAAKIPYEKEFADKKAQYEEAMKSYVPPAKEEEEEDEDEDDEEEDGEAEDDEESPKKRKGAASADAPAAKKGKSGSVSAEVEAEAKKLGLLVKLKTLVENPKVTCSASDVLAELQKTNGSVVAAKKALLGA